MDWRNVMGQQEMLNQLDTAIQNILVGGQSYKIGSRQLTRADLKTLQDMRNNLQAEINQNQSSSLLSDTYVAYFEGR